MGEKKLIESLERPIGLCCIVVVQTSSIEIRAQ